MQHRIPVERLGPQGEGMAEAVRACVHCGFCLATCPTYEVLGQEMDSPRGRIVLMKEVLEGDLELDDALPHIDRCLGCLACEPACPSGVPYHKLLGPFRARAETMRRRPPMERLVRSVLSSTLPYADRFRRAMTLGRWSAPLRGLAPKAFRPMLDLVPPSVPPRVRLSARTTPKTTRAKVALLAGCAQQVIDPAINQATIEVLTGQGVEVVVPPGMGCCGALDWHAGNLERAQAHARRLLAAIPDDVDALVTNAAGCGSCLKEYALVLGEEVPSLVAKDVSEFLDELGFEPPPGPAKPLRVAYQDACHLRNAQGIEAAPRRLLAAIPNVELVELASPHRCCGSAGTYNIEQPEIAAELGRRKAADIAAAEVDVVVSGNIGCLTQLRTHGVARAVHLMVFLTRNRH